MERILSWLRAHRAVLLSLAAAALLAGGTLVIVIDTDGPDGPSPGITLTVGAAQAAPVGVVAHDVSGPVATIGDPSRPLAPTATIDGNQQLSPSEQVDDHGIDVHEDSKDETPPGVAPAAAEALVEQKTAPGVTTPRPPAGAQTYSCKYAPVVNQSARTTRVQLGVLHYTVSRNIPGWGDVWAIWQLFNTPSFGASSTYIVDFEGHCLKLMPFGSRPWTQLAFNNVSWSIEIIAYGNETRQQWLASPLIRNGILASLVRDAQRANGLPLRFVDPQGCHVQLAGLTDHYHLECGNDHHDVRPAFPYDLFQRQLVAGVAPPPSTKIERRIIRGVTRPKGTGHSRRYWCQRNRDQRQRILAAARGRGASAGTGWVRHRGERYQLLAKPYAKACR